MQMFYTTLQPLRNSTQFDFHLEIATGLLFRDFIVELNSTIFRPSHFGLHRDLFPNLSFLINKAEVVPSVKSAALGKRKDHRHSISASKVDKQLMIMTVK